MDLREALIERKARDELMERYEATKEIQAKLKTLKATGLDKLQELMNGSPYLGGDWVKYMNKHLSDMEAWG